MTKQFKNKMLTMLSRKHSTIKFHIHLIEALYIDYDNDSMDDTLYLQMKPAVQVLQKQLNQVLDEIEALQKTPVTA